MLLERAADAGVLFFGGTTCLDGWMHGWKGGWVDGWMDGGMDGWVGGWMDR